MNRMKRTRRYIPWQTVCLLVLLAFSMQSCLGIGGSSGNFKTQSTGNGSQIGISTQALFTGHIYFTQNRHLYVIDGSRTIRTLETYGDIRDPAVSPDGKWIVFIVRYYDYSQIQYMSTSGGSWHMLMNGNGQFLSNPGFAPKSTHHWFAQPAWSRDGKTIIFLSDLQKLYDWANYSYGDLGTDFDQSPFLDMQVFYIPFNPSASPPNLSDVETNNAVAYASYGDGGNRDPGFQPNTGSTNAIIYTHYTYDTSHTQQLIQLFMEDPYAIKNNPQIHYHPGDPGAEYSPGIAITPASTSISNIEPAFSPDGKHIAYIRNIDATHMGLYVMPTPSDSIVANPNNATVQKQALQAYNHSQLLVEGSFVSQPIWSPDGKQLAYIFYSNNEFDIWIANLNYNAKTDTYSVKGSLLPLTSGGVDADSRPVWTA